MMTKVNSNIFDIMEEWAPSSLSYEWDNPGLQIGSYHNPVKKIMITLDVLESVVDEAIENNVSLIIAHHPLLFKPIKKINVDIPQGRVIHKLMQHNISVYASHTNLDIAAGGVNDMLCDALQLKSREVLAETSGQKLYKIVVYVPTSHINEVREAFHTGGAGYIGNYSHCTFQAAGKGSFKPLEGTNPYIGNQNEVEKVDEFKIESIVQEEKLSQVIRAIIDAHPYEEPAYDIFPLENKGTSLGLGRIGALDHAVTLGAFCRHVKAAFGISDLRVSGDLTKEVKWVAILGGSGEKYIDTAKEKGADVYITGDMSFHAAQEAWQCGLSVIDPGHYIETIMKKGAKDYLDDKLTNDNIEVIVSQVNTEPFQFM
ncbi:Nif3-like dinuclear metal center hexameric protein [Virgibacillus sp. NKC19-3]|uniref:Nif3-like dinuclear metal center hexameric protein n=1 Tax=Virgibacillus saliphilus TaxID=2831674 RepID=UPI001C9A3261|nr:Nif3-like dinuclear metal center hexameric protein [Virgibacillus sp. NKC19-3]MBY7143361.1 Nif3-like dinuclear metal center hexameric protein [Virgibacillus sp. NKC19-3]